MKNKNITLDTLADMMEAGFEHVLSGLEKTATKEQLEKLNSRMVKVEVRLSNIEEEVSAIRKHQAMHTIFRDEFEKLDSRVKNLEKLLVKG